MSDGTPITQLIIYTVCDHVTPVQKDGSLDQKGRERLSSPAASGFGASVALGF